MNKDCKAKKKTSDVKRGPIKHPNRESNSKLNQISVNLKKIKPDAKIPVYKTKEAAGADLTPCESRQIYRHSTKKIPTGIAVEIPEGFHAEIHARSSMLIKNVSVTGIIDSDYNREIFLIVTNHNPYPLEYSKDGKAIAQIIFIPQEQARFKEVETLAPTERKGGFGSTEVNTLTIHPGKLVFKGKISGEKAEFLINNGADGVFCG